MERLGITTELLLFNLQVYQGTQVHQDIQVSRVTRAFLVTLEEADIQAYQVILEFLDIVELLEFLVTLEHLEYLDTQVLAVILDLPAVEVLQDIVVFLGIQEFRDIVELLVILAYQVTLE